MKKVVLFIIAISLYLCGCSGSTKAPQTEVAATSAGTNALTEHTNFNASARAYGTLDAKFVNRPYPDSSEWADEAIIEVQSEEDVSRILDLHAKALKKSHGEPVLARIHAVVRVAGSSQIEHLNQVFRSIGNVVSTFEVVFTGPVTETMDTIELSSGPERHTRMIISGDGDTPVDVSLLLFKLEGDVVEARNLVWQDAPVPYTRLQVRARRYFVMDHVTMRNCPDTDEGAVAAEPLIVLTATSNSTDELRLAFNHVEFRSNRVRTLMTVNNTDKLAQMRFNRLTMIDNDNLDQGIEISPKYLVEVEDSSITGGKFASAFIQRMPDPLVVMRRSKLAGFVYDYAPHQMDDGRPKELVLENNDVAEKVAFSLQDNMNITQ